MKFKVGFKKNNSESEIIEADNILAAKLFYCQKNKINFLTFRNFISANPVAGISSTPEKQNRTMGNETWEAQKHRQKMEAEMAIDNKVKEIEQTYKEAIADIKAGNTPAFFTDLETNNISPEDATRGDIKVTSKIMEMKERLSQARKDRVDRENRIEVLKGMMPQSVIDDLSLEDQEKQLSPEQWKEYFVRQMQSAESKEKEANEFSEEE